MGSGGFGDSEIRILSRTLSLGEPHFTNLYNGNNDAFFFWPQGVAGGILVSRPGIEPTSPALEGRSLTTELLGGPGNYNDFKD